jgi:hypothetical protein
VATTAFTVNQTFLAFTVIYVLPPILMVPMSLLLKAGVNRVVNIVVSLLYMATIIASCIGEGWVYYILGSVIEAMLLLAIARTAWRWGSAD